MLAFLHLFVSSGVRQLQFHIALTAEGEGSGGFYRINWRNFPPKRLPASTARFNLAAAEIKFHSLTVSLFSLKDEHFCPPPIIKIGARRLL